MNPRRFLPLAILGVFVAVAVTLFWSSPEAERRPPEPITPITVETMSVSARPFTIELESFGTVQPRTRTLLVSQVSGKIEEVSPQFRDGSFFEKGDVLLHLEDRDYQAQLIQAKAELTAARQTLVEERAKAESARIDWQRSNGQREAPDLVLRKPQVATAEARMQSAQAALTTAELNLARTRITAPYAGRVLRKQVDVGHVVSTSTTLAEIYATDYLEVRLPLKNADLRFIDLPENYRYKKVDLEQAPGVTLISRLGQREEWLARLVRTEGAIDRDSQQLYVVAQLDDPYGPASEDKSPLKINQYVTARIRGRKLEEALVIPNHSIYQGSYVYVVSQQEYLQRREIQIAWQNEDLALVADGLRSGERLVTTPLGQVVSGTRVQFKAGDRLAGDREELERTATGVLKPRLDGQLPNVGIQSSVRESLP